MSVSLISKAIVDTIISVPFFASLIMRMKIVENDSIPTAATDGKRILFNAKFFEKLKAENKKYLVFVLCHEIMHCVLGHFSRLNGRDAMLWNAAGDYVINLILSDCGLVRPPNCLYDEKYKGLTTEEVYAILARDQKTQDKLKSKQDWNMGEVRPGNSLPSDGEDGEAESGEAGDKDGSGSGRQTDEALAREWKDAAVAAANVSRMAGKLPAALGGLISELFAPRIPWRATLEEFLRERTQDDWSYRKVRQVGRTILPTLREGHTGTVVVAVDTSGSTMQYIDEFVSEVVHLGAALNLSLVVMDVDTRISRVQTLAPGEEPERSWSGGGGTSFDAPFEWVNAGNCEGEVSAIVYITDGYGDVSGSVDTGLPTIWVVPRSANREFAPAFGDVLRADFGR